MACPLPGRGVSIPCGMNTGSEPPRPPSLLWKIVKGLLMVMLGLVIAGLLLFGVCFAIMQR